MAPPGQIVASLGTIPRQKADCSDCGGRSGAISEGMGMESLFRPDIPRRAYFGFWALRQFVRLAGAREKQEQSKVSHGVIPKILNCFIILRLAFISTTGINAIRF